MFPRHNDGSTQPVPEAYELVSGGDDDAPERLQGDTSTEASLMHTVEAEPNEPDPDEQRAPPPPPPKQTNNPKSTIRIWWPETALCLLVFLALAAMVGLRVSDGKPLPKLPYRMSINTLVAVYILIMKASILVIVSNGLGQLKWAWFSLEKPRPLAELGMLDDASHDLQGGRRHDSSDNLGSSWIIKFYSCTIPDTPTAAWIATSHVPQTVSYGESALVYIRPELSGAIFQGLYTERPIQVPFRCSGGECRFPRQYHSTGISARCVDMTSHIVIQRPKNISEYGLDIFDPLKTVEPNATTVFQLPSGLNATSATPFLVHVSGNSGNAVPDKNHRQDDTVNNPPTDNWIKFSILLGLFANRSEAPFFAGVDCSFPDMWACTGYGAAECSLYPCVKTLQADVESGILTNLPVSESTAWGCPEHSSLCSTIGTTCLTDSERKTLISRGYEVKPGVEWMAYNLTGHAQGACEKFHPSHGNPTNNPNRLSGNMGIRPECIYQVSLVEWSFLFRYMRTHFSEAVPIKRFLDMWNSVFYEGGNISAASIETRISQLARAMSAAYQGLGTSTRDLDGSASASVYNTASTSRVAGEAFRKDTCVSVQWPWIAFPAVLAVATSFFWS
ncbi:hypothetical protein B0T14DRAFT_561777 [Immersiella caudata]|uniref:Uncharacterized protein n=1 Tax=Immersiella caudata TaxID=314043 RepID=A0AA39X1Y9_9PEZI|nr:hypothetical protein B0T14DRAFT_561777 [Immersiella caudata]